MVWDMFCVMLAIVLLHSRESRYSFRVRMSEVRVASLLPRPDTMQKYLRSKLIKDLEK